MNPQRKDVFVILGTITLPFVVYQIFYSVWWTIVRLKPVGLKDSNIDIVSLITLVSVGGLLLFLSGYVVVRYAHKSILYSVIVGFIIGMESVLWQGATAIRYHGFRDVASLYAAGILSLVFFAGLHSIVSLMGGLLGRYQLKNDQ